MHSTLFHVPLKVAGLPMFGYGVLLVVWAVFTTWLLVSLVRRQGFNADTRSFLPILIGIGAVIAFILPAICDEDGLPIRGYGTLLIVAVVSGVSLAMYRARRVGVDPELIMALAYWLFVGGLVGGRLFFVIEYWDTRFSPAAVERIDRIRQQASLSPSDVPFDTAGDDKAAEPSGVAHVSPLLRSLKEILRIDTGGLVVYGALLVGGLALMLFIRTYRVPGLALSDLIAPSVVLGMGIGRLGCFMNGCCFGGPCDLPWAVTFPADSPPHDQQIRYGQVYGLLIVGNADHRPVIAKIEPDMPAAVASLQVGQEILAINRQPTATLEEAQRQLYRVFESKDRLELTTKQGICRLPAIEGTYEHSRPVHPAQLYSAIDAFLLCGLLLAYYPYRRRDGEVTALTLTIHPISRFLLEIIRTDEAPIFGTGMSISQNISLMILCGGICLWIYLAFQPRATAWPAESGVRPSHAGN